jgi:hypothetical protein
MSPLLLFLLYLLIFVKAVIDNKDALEELVTRTAERLALVNNTLVDEDEGIKREMIEHFAGYAQCYLEHFGSDMVQDTYRKLARTQQGVEEGNVEENSGERRGQEEDQGNLRADRRTYEEFLCAFADISHLTMILTLCLSAQTYANH